MSKFLHRDAAHEPGAPSEAAFNAADRLGIVWPALPWSCPRCGKTYENHKETIATVDLELASSFREILDMAPKVLSSPRLMPKSRRAIEAFAEYLRADMAEHGPPAAFLCIMCDLMNYATPHIVHVLEAGRSWCGLRGVPNEWPTGHKWVGRREAALATCAVCKQMISTEEA